METTQSDNKIYNLLLCGYARHDHMIVPNPIISMIKNYYFAIIPHSYCLLIQNLKDAPNFKLINIHQNQEQLTINTIKSLHTFTDDTKEEKLDINDEMKYVWKSSDLFKNVKLPISIVNKYENHLKKNKYYDVMFWQKSNKHDPHFFLNRLKGQH